MKEGGRAWLHPPDDSKTQPCPPRGLPVPSRVLSRSHFNLCLPGPLQSTQVHPPVFSCRCDAQDPQPGPSWLAPEATWSRRAPPECGGFTAAGSPSQGQGQGRSGSHPSSVRMNACPTDAQSSGECEPLPAWSPTGARLPLTRPVQQPQAPGTRTEASSAWAPHR